jgi:nucleotide-binding universal stress UspA family protein
VKAVPLPRGRQSRVLTARNPAGFNSIVVPIDFSETSLKALDYALALGGEFGSQIHLVHALEMPTAFNSLPKPATAFWDKDGKKSASTRLNDLIEERFGEWITANSEVRTERPYLAICETARERKADLIIIGTHGFSGLKHLFLGSTAERVIRHAPCSVLTVRTQNLRRAQAVVKPKKLLVPTDFSKSAEVALRSAVALAKEFGTQLYLLYVVPAHHQAGEFDSIDYQSFEAYELKAAQKTLVSMSKQLIANKISVEIEIRRGRPATEINAAARELGVDLIAISTHGRTGWQHALLGGTTEEVVRHSVCPVLIVRKL